MDGTHMWDVNESKFTVLQKEKVEKTDNASLTLSYQGFLTPYYITP